MVQLGEAEDPITRKKSVDLQVARNTIDLLGVLKEKTEGNLDEEEARLLESVLYECRTKFIEKSK